MALTSVSFDTKFDITNDKFVFTDTVDYSVTTVANCDGVFKIVSPDGLTHYNNTSYASPDIDPDVALTNSTTISLPTDVNGDVQLGTYTITYSVQDTTSGTVVITQTETFEYSYVTPTMSLSTTVNCLVPKVEMTDDTNYTQDSTDPTITRAMKLHYPPSLSLADVTGTGKTLSTTVVYTGAQSGSNTSTLTYSFDDYDVADQITGDTAFNVVCDGDLCDIYCCMSAQWTRYTNEKTRNPHLAEQYLEVWIRMMGICEMIRVALECGKDTDVSAYKDEILTLGNCQPGCGCNDGDPVAVTGLGATGNTVAVDSGGSPITVSSAEAGGITTYTVSFDSTLSSKLNAAYNTVVASANSDLTVAVATSGDTKTYTITYAGDAPTDMVSFLIKIDIATGATPQFTLSDYTLTGGYFTNSGLSVTNKETVLVDWLSKYNGFTLGSFLAGAAGSQQVKPHIEIVKFTHDNTEYNTKFTDVFDRINPYSVQIVDYSQTEVKFRLVHGRGLVTGSGMTSFESTFLSEIYLRVTLIA